jgi:Zn-dependent protease
MESPLLRFIGAIQEGNNVVATAYLSYMLVILLIAFPVHELAHALVADRLGDDTPRMAGRITLNPFRHLSVLGSVLFLMIGFGWATTPINPMNFRGNWRLKHAAVAVAGPISNLLLAAVFAGIFRLGDAFLPRGPEAGLAERAIMIASFLAVEINLFLAFLNLIPIPPFDGGTVLKAFASDGVAALLDRVGQFGWIILYALSRAGILGAMINPPVAALLNLLIGGPSI